MNATLASLDLHGVTLLANNVALSGPRKNLFVPGSSTASGSLANSRGIYRLGNRSGYSAAKTQFGLAVSSTVAGDFNGSAAGPAPCWSIKHRHSISFR